MERVLNQGHPARHEEVILPLERSTDDDSTIGEPIAAPEIVAEMDDFPETGDDDFDDFDEDDFDDDFDDDFEEELEDEVGIDDDNFDDGDFEDEDDEDEEEEEESDEEE